MNDKKIDELEFLNVGDSVEGRIIGIEKNSLYVDLPPYGTGIIFGKEFLIIKDVIRKINVGDNITAKIIDLEGEDGYIELSLREARAAIVWKEAEELMKKKTQVSALIKDANKGGLMVVWQGTTGFLPVSKLSEKNYPKVSGGDKNAILSELKRFVGERMDLVVITVDREEEKLIFSEKLEDASSDRKSSSSENIDVIKTYSVGDEFEGEVAGIVEFGIFVKLPEGKEGLVHISEISWSLVDDVKKLYQVGDSVKVKVIEVDREKVSLSIKALLVNPWQEAEGKYKKGDLVDAIVIKLSSHGALVSVQEGIYGLVHISEFENPEDFKEKMKLGKSYNLQVNVFDSKSEKMTLVLPKVEK